MDVAARWSQVMAGPEGSLPLDEAALLISACAQPGLDVQAQLGRLDDIAAGVRPGRVDDLCQVLFEGMGLRGDMENYDEPANSYIDQVLDRRRGIPISLSVLLIEIGRRRGIELQAVGMPGHFLVRDPADGGFIDAFNGGRRLDRAGCEQLLQAVTGRPARLSPEMLAPTGTRAVLARMLANLDRSFEQRGDLGSLAWVTGLRLAIPEVGVGDRAQLAGRLAALGRFDAAAELLEEVASASAGMGGQQERLLKAASTLRARLN